MLCHNAFLRCNEFDLTEDGVLVAHHQTLALSIPFEADCMYINKDESIHGLLVSVDPAYSQNEFLIIAVVALGELPEIVFEVELRIRHAAEVDS